MAKLYYYFGCMGSTKTATLLTTDFNYLEKGMKTLILTSSVDTRYKVGKVKSRIGLEADAIVVNENTNIFELVKEYIERNGVIQAISIEEVNFYTIEHINQLSDVVDYLNIDVLCYGIRTDFKTESFPATTRLFEIADKIIEIKSMCHCGQKASVNSRVVNGKIAKEGEKILIGGNESYISLCRKCWKDENLPSINI